MKVHYWGAYGRNDGRDRGTYDEMIERLDKLDDDLRMLLEADRRAKLRKERAELIRRLDHWASPAAPQTPVRAEAILFPGTRHERRWRFKLLSQRTGQLLSLGEVEITGAMLQAARRRAP